MGGSQHKAMVAQKRKERRYIRVKLPTSAVIHNGAAAEDARAVNISLGGIYIRAENSRPEGTQVNMEIVLPPNRRLPVKGMVVRTAHHQDEEKPAGMGIAFDRFPEGVREEIDRYVKHTYRVLRALFFELSKTRINKAKVRELVNESPIEHQYSLDILREMVASELANIKLRDGAVFRR